MSLDVVVPFNRDEDSAEIRTRQIRVLEALLFAASEPLAERDLAPHLGEGAPVTELLAAVREKYREAGVNLVLRDGKWAFRTAEDLGYLLRRDHVDQRPLSRAALETMAIIAYHQPVTRAEIEEIRGVGMSRGVLDVLLETGWVRMRGRKRTVGRPVTYGTTEAFLDQFGLEAVADLPGLEDLKAAGLLQSNLPRGFEVPSPASAVLTEDEDPLDPGDTGEDAPHEPNAG